MASGFQIIKAYYLSFIPTPCPVPHFPPRKCSIKRTPVLLRLMTQQHTKSKVVVSWNASGRRCVFSLTEVAFQQGPTLSTLVSSFGAVMYFSSTNSSERLETLGGGCGYMTVREFEEWSLSFSLLSVIWTRLSLSSSGQDHSKREKETNSNSSFTPSMASL